MKTKVTKIGAHGLHVMLPKTEFNKDDEIIVTKADEVNQPEPKQQPQLEQPQPEQSDIAVDQLNVVTLAIKKHEDEFH